LDISGSESAEVVRPTNPDTIGDPNDPDDPRHQMPSDLPTEAILRAPGYLLVEGQQAKTMDTHAIGGGRGIPFASRGVDQPEFAEHLQQGHPVVVIDPDGTRHVVRENPRAYVGLDGDVHLAPVDHPTYYPERGHEEELNDGTTRIV
jgi:hypothetical protein